MSGSFFTELKRRGVLRAPAVYLVAAWVAVQVALTVAPLLSLAEAVPQWILTSAIIGFPFALIIAWIYQRTPEGLTRDAAAVTSVRVRGRLAMVAVVALAFADATTTTSRTSLDLPPRYVRKAGWLSSPVTGMLPFVPTDTICTSDTAQMDHSEKKSMRSGLR